MKHSLKTGFSFGITSGIITTLGLMVGLHSGTHSKLSVLGGIFTIAIADAFSDALGIHVSEESENMHSAKEIWQSTGSTFAAKFIIAITFAVPVLLLPLGEAMLAGVVYGMALLAMLSFYISNGGRRKSFGNVAEHLVIALAVILIAHFAGEWIGLVFGG